MPKAPPGNPQFALSDSLRAIAILGVIACHVSPAAIGRFWWGTIAWNGSVGVDIFFMLSGFLLYRPYLAARVAGRPLPSTWGFLRRRAFRILPAYWVALTLVAIWPGVPGVFSAGWWRYYGLLQIYPLGPSGGGLGVAWTLCIEVSFYLVLPFFAAVMSRLARADAARGWARRELLVLAVLGTGAFLVRLAVAFGHLPPWMDTTLAGQFDYFAVGMALAVASVAVAGLNRPPRWVSPIDRYPGLFFGLALLVFLGMCHFVPERDPNIPVLGLVMRPISFLHEEADYWLIALTALLLMLPVVFGDPRRGLSRRVLAARPIVGIGVISYGIYLWQVPILSQIIPYVGTEPSRWIFGSPVPTMFLATLAISVPVALLSYRWVELPFLRRRYSSRAASPVVARPQRPANRTGPAST